MFFKKKKDNRTFSHSDICVVFCVGGVGLTTGTEETAPPWADTLTDADVSVAGVDEGSEAEAEAEAESVGRTEAEGVSNCSPRGGARAGDGKTAVNLGCLSMTEVSSATRSS